LRRAAAARPLECIIQSVQVAAAKLGGIKLRAPSKAYFEACGIQGLDVS
jgi:hypothetical protein